MVISSRQNAKIKRIASLKEKKFRSEYGEYVVEGVKMVKEAISAGVEIKEVVGIESVIETLPPFTAPVTYTDEYVFASLTETKTPQGVLAVIKMPENRKESPMCNCAVLDGVADPGNLGTIIRTCSALGIKDIYLCNCADAFSPKVIRSSMSGIFFTEIHSFDRDVIYSLIKDTVITVADMGGENLFDTDIPMRYSIVIGNEANGVSDFFKEKANKTISIPMSANTESLNAAVSFAVIAYTFAAKSGRF